MVRQNLCRLIIWKKVSNDLEDWSYYGASLNAILNKNESNVISRSCMHWLFASFPPFNSELNEFRFSIEKIIREHPIDDRRAIAICVGSKLDEPFGQVILSLRLPL